MTKVKESDIVKNIIKDVAHLDNKPLVSNAKTLEELDVLFEFLFNENPGLLRSILDRYFPMEKELSHTNHVCLKTKNRLRYRCKDTSCKYWINYLPSDNCLNIYIVTHKNEDDKEEKNLSFTEISFLLQWSISKISTNFEKAISKMRSQALKALIFNGHIEQDFIIKPNPNVCVVCESYVKEDYYKKIEDKVWCTEECYEEEYPHEIDIQIRYGIEISNIFKLLLRNFENWQSTIPDPLIKQLCNILGITQEEFLLSYDKYKDTIFSKYVIPVKTITKYMMFNQDVGLKNKMLKVRREKKAIFIKEQENFSEVEVPSSLKKVIDMFNFS